MKSLRAFFHDTFTDVLNQPSALLATAFGVNASVCMVLPVGLLTNRWPPAEILLVIVTYAAVLLGLDFNLTRTKIQADNPQPASVVGSAQNVTVNAESDATQ